MNDLEKQERMLDLLTERATYGLSKESQQELEELIKIFPEWQDDETLTLTTAAMLCRRWMRAEKCPII